jgi:ubiquitin C-terminal hydrolase
LARIQSTLQCASCDYSTRCAPEWFLTISLPLALVQRDTGSLTDCLERLQSGETDAPCPQCKKKRQISKTDRFSILPPVLVFHLRRFAYFSGPRGRKLTFHVPFPDELDMSPYAIRPSFYDLRSIVVHSGSLHNGHFVAYVRIDDMWYCFDDASVYRSDPDTVSRQEAYLLFYERRQ